MSLKAEGAAKQSPTMSLKAEGAAKQSPTMSLKAEGAAKQSPLEVVIGRRDKEVFFILSPNKAG